MATWKALGNILHNGDLLPEGTLIQGESLGSDSVRHLLKQGMIAAVADEPAEVRIDAELPESIEQAAVPDEPPATIPIETKGRKGK